MLRERISRARGLWLAVFLSISGCERKSDETKPESKDRSGAAAVSRGSRRIAPPTDVLVLEHTAYGPSLSFAGENLVLLTTEAAYVATPGKKPERFPYPFGAHRTLAEEKVVFWEKETFFSVPLRGGEKKILAKTKREPSLLVTAGSRPVWVEKDETGTSSLFAAAEDSVKLLHRTSGAIVALETLGDAVFFVEVSAPGAFRIGRASVSSKEPEKIEWAPARTGRPPAMLAVNGEALFYYDGAARSVRKLSPDFAIDEKIAEKMVCSPLAAKEKVYCANVGGLFAIEDGRPVPLVAEPRGPTAAMAVNENHLAFLNDAGENKLVVRVVELAR